MKKSLRVILLTVLMLTACGRVTPSRMTLWQSSKAGDHLADKGSIAPLETADSGRQTLRVKPEETFQTIVGFGGAFTESSAFVLDGLSDAKRAEVLDKYFGPDGAAYSLCRTHINSCDFSLSHYAYDMVDGDRNLENFSIEEDMEDLIPLIRDAMTASKDGFKILASPWTAPPWMKDNKNWNGGALKPEYYDTWALYFSKYIQAYADQGIPVWGLTVENEPLGNGGQWDSMIFSVETMAEFIKHHLGPQLEKDGLEPEILIYDQNRDELEEWAAMLDDPDVSKFVWGTAVHWYSSTVDWYPETLQAVGRQYPDKPLMHTEGCIDNIGNDEPEGVWLKDDWYWERKATDWGYYWAVEKDKPNHPPYSPVYRYARDIIGCLNSGLTGWIDWNIVLNFEGGPNHANNWCLAPVLANPETDTIYYTPLYYVMSHFSKFIRPGARRIGLETEAKTLMSTAFKNMDGSIVVTLLNQTDESEKIKIRLGKSVYPVNVPHNALQTLVLK